MEEKKYEELDLEQLDKVAGGNIADDARVVKVVALRDIAAAIGPGEVGQTIEGRTFELAFRIPAGTEFNVYIDYQMYGYIYSNTIINPQFGSSYQYFYVKIDDVLVK